MTSSARLDVPTDAARERRDLRTASVALVVLLAVVVAMYLRNREPEPASENQYSAFTADQLLHDWPDADAFPLVVPVSLPQGTDSADSATFALSNVVVDPDDPSDRRVWVQYYDSDVIGGSFRVFQRPDSVLASSPCGPMGDVLHLERGVPGGAVTVCSNDLSTPDAEQYWSTVDLTSDLNSVAWLED